MKADTFVALGLAAAASTVVAIALHASSNTWTAGGVAGAKLVPALSAAKPEVASLVLRHGAATLTLESKGGRFGLKERGDYPADAEKVRTLLVKLAQAELIEPKTRNPDRHALLEVEDPAAKDAKSRALRVLDAKGGTIADLIVGKQRYDAFGSGKGGTYVRRAGEVATWLASGEIELPVETRAWIKPAIIEADSAKISRLTIEIPGEAPLEIKREGEKADGRAAFVGLPEGRKLKDVSAADAVLRAAALIEADDVRKAPATPALEGVATVTFATRDGLAVILKLRKDGADTWISVAAAGEGDVKAAADAIKAKAEGFELKIPAAKADSLLKRRADLVEGS